MAKSDDDSKTPILPTVDERMQVRTVDAPHPAVMAPDDLLNECDLRTQRRSGPGGQHRNKTSSGVFLQHKPTEIVGEATERRSQAHNRVEALERLRYRLAVELRTSSVFDGEASAEEEAIRLAYHNKSLKMNDANPSKPAVLAMLLNDLHASGGQPSAVAKEWSVSTSSIVSLLKSHPAAFRLVNQFRAHHGKRALK